jgi:hypothetical protein
LTVLNVLRQKNTIRQLRNYATGALSMQNFAGGGTLGSALPLLFPRHLSHFISAMAAGGTAARSSGNRHAFSLSLSLSLYLSISLPLLDVTAALQQQHAEKPVWGDIHQLS